MVRILTETVRTNDGKRYIEAVGLSTDTKPTANVITGSTYIAVNTGDVYLYDEDGATWNKL